MFSLTVASRWPKVNVDGIYVYICMYVPKGNALQCLYDGRVRRKSLWDMN